MTTSKKPPSTPDIKPTSAGVVDPIDLHKLSETETTAQGYRDQAMKIINSPKAIAVAAGAAAALVTTIPVGIAVGGTAYAGKKLIDLGEQRGQDKLMTKAIIQKGSAGLPPEVTEKIMRKAA